MFSKAIEICIFVLSLSLILQSPIAYAQEEEPPEPPIVNIEFDIEAIIESITGLGDALGTTIASVPTQVFNVFKDSFKSSLTNFDSPMLELTAFLLYANPNPDAVYNWWQSIVLIISSFYLLLFLLIGFMFLFSSINSEKRIEAKEWLKNAFMMIIAINISFWLYKVILELSTAITQYMWISGFEQFFEVTVLTGAEAFLLIFYAIAVGIALLTLFIRYVFLLVGVMLFPIGIFLYFIPPLKNWGTMIFNLIGIALFMQFFDVIVFVAANQVAIDLAGQQGATFVPALSFLLVGILNIIIIFYAVLKAAFSATQNSSVLAFAFGAITGQIGSLISAIKPVEGKK